MPTKQSCIKCGLFRCWGFSTKYFSDLSEYFKHHCGRCSIDHVNALIRDGTLKKEDVYKKTGGCEHSRDCDKATTFYGQGGCRRPYWCRCRDQSLFVEKMNDLRAQEQGDYVASSAVILIGLLAPLTEDKRKIHKIKKGIKTHLSISPRRRKETLEFLQGLTVDLGLSEANVSEANVSEALGHLWKKFADEE